MSTLTGYRGGSTGLLWHEEKCHGKLRRWGKKQSKRAVLWREGDFSEKLFLAREKKLLGKVEMREGDFGIGKEVIAKCKAILG